MADDTGYLEAKRLRAEAQRLRDEAAEHNAQADRKLRDGNYALGQAEHRHRLIADLERSVAQREAKLVELGEGKLLEREKLAEAKLAEAKALMADYDKEKYAALRVLTEARP
jgi:hypothetical protein